MKSRVILLTVLLLATSFSALLSVEQVEAKGVLDQSDTFWVDGWVLSRHAKAGDSVEIFAETSPQPDDVTAKVYLYDLALMSVLDGMIPPTHTKQLLDTVTMA